MEKITPRTYCLALSTMEYLFVNFNADNLCPGAEEGRKLAERFSCQYDIRAASFLTAL